MMAGEGLIGMAQGIQVLTTRITDQKIPLILLVRMWFYVHRMRLYVYWLKDVTKAILQLGYFIGNLEYTLMRTRWASATVVTLRIRLASIRHVRSGSFVPERQSEKESHAQGPKPNCHFMSILVGKVRSSLGRLASQYLWKRYWASLDHWWVI